MKNPERVEIEVTGNNAELRACHALVTGSSKLFQIIVYNPVAEPRTGLIASLHHLEYKSFEQYIKALDDLAVSTVFLVEFKTNIQLIHKSLMKYNLNIKKGAATFEDTEGRRKLHETLKTLNAKSVEVIESYIKLLASSTQTSQIITKLMETGKEGN